MAGACSSASAPDGPNSARLEINDRSPSPSEIGWIRGMMSARVFATARKASLATRAARRVGNRSVIFGSDRISGARPPGAGRSPFKIARASASRNGTPSGRVKTLAPINRNSSSGAA